MIQNITLRIATGCHHRATSAHMHTKTRILPIEDSLDLLWRQYLASALCPSHPSHAIVTQSSGSRIKKYTLQSKHMESARPFLMHNNHTPDKTKIAQHKNHTKTVQDSFLNTPPNSVLHEPAPEISLRNSLSPGLSR